MTLKPEHIVEALNKTPELKRRLILRIMEELLDSEAFMEAYPRLYDPAAAEASPEYREKVREELAQIIVRLFHKNKVRPDDAEEALNRARGTYLEMYEVLAAALLHDYCKVGKYRDKGNGEYEYFDAGLVGHGEGSVIMAQQYIKLTAREIEAIRWHMGAYSGSQDWDTLSAVYDRYPEALCLHFADMIATHYDEVPF